jgi:hypothetical protein
MVKLSAASQTALKSFWKKLLPGTARKWGVTPATSVVDLTISTDASKLAWGACLHGNHKAIKGEQLFTTARQTWPTLQQAEHIYLLEL